MTVVTEDEHPPAPPRAPYDARDFAVLGGALAVAAVVALATQAAVIGEKAPAEAPLMIGWVHDSGEQLFVAI